MTVIRSTSSIYPRLDAEQLAAAMAGTLKIYWHNQRVVRPLRGDDVAAFDLAVVKGYVVGGRSAWDLFSAYFHWCEVHERPYVRVRRRSNCYAEVEVDLITCPSGHRLNREQAEAIRQLLRDAVPQRGWWSLFSGPTSCSCSRVMLDLAEQTAAEIYAIAARREHYEPMTMDANGLAQQHGDVRAWAAEGIR